MTPDVTVEFKLNEFVDDSAVGLQGCSLYLLANTLRAERFRRFKESYHRERRVWEVPIREFSIWSFSDCELMNISFSWKLSLVFLAFGPLRTSR